MWPDGINLYAFDLREAASATNPRLLTPGDIVDRAPFLDEGRLVWSRDGSVYFQDLELAPFATNPRPLSDPTARDPTQEPAGEILIDGQLVIWRGPSLARGARLFRYDLGEPSSPSNPIVFGRINGPLDLAPNHALSDGKILRLREVFPVNAGPPYIPMEVLLPEPGFPLLTGMGLGALLLLARTRRSDRARLPGPRSPKDRS